jgi:DNA polymerase I-like protein with 3'-5' exonuclease and polymerase domains
MAINMPIQGTAADGMKIAMVRLDAELRERDLRESRMLLQVHDELVFETTAEELSPLATTVRDVMEAALPLDIPLTVDLKAGQNWEQMDLLEQVEDETWRRVSGTAAEIARNEADEETAVSSIAGA